MIKSTFIAAIPCAIICLAACQQNETPPENITSVFNHKFTDVENVEWEMESEMEWEAEFEKDGIQHSAVFNLEGEWLETESQIAESEIPENIRMMMDENFANYKIEEGEKAETPNGIAYEFEIESNGQKWEVNIDTDGNLTQEIIEDEEDTQD